MHGGRVLVVTAAVLLAGCGGGAASEPAQPTYGTLIQPGEMPSIPNPPPVLDSDAPRPAGRSESPTAAPPVIEPTAPVPAASLPPADSNPVGVGTTTPAASVPSVTSTSVADTNPVIPAGPVPDPVGGRVGGNRVLALGDSILASVSARYTDDVCTELMSLGWDVEIEAESGKFVTFGAQVLKKLRKQPQPIVRRPETPPAGADTAATAPLGVPQAAGTGQWDVVLIEFGSNYMEDPTAFRKELVALIEAVAPAHVVLSTVTEFEDSRVEVNSIIREVAESVGERATLFNWAEASAYFSTYLGGDGLHLTSDGRIGYAELLGHLFGRAPASATVGCRDSLFTDDSAGPVTPSKTPPKGTKPTTGSSTRPTSGSTPKPTTTTEAPPPPPDTQPPEPGG